MYQKRMLNISSKELLTAITEFLKVNHAVTGMAVTEQIDGYMTSSIDFALNCDKEPKLFKIVLTETKKNLI